MITREEVEKDRQTFHDKVMRRHPGRRSLCGALLAEVVSGADVRDRGIAAWEMYLCSCRRGLNRLRPLVEKLEMTLDHDDTGAPESDLFQNMLCAIGGMDTDESHELLVEMLRRAQHPRAESSVLDGMAFERDQFEIKLMWPFLDREIGPGPFDQMPVLSALYALYNHSHASENPKEVKRHVSRLLKHPNRQIRSYCVMALRGVPGCRELIRKLTNDPDPQVRRDATDAVRDIYYEG